MTEDDRLKVYPRTEHFSVEDTIGVPHPYCITPKHLLPGRIYIDAESIREAEKQGAECDICKKAVRAGKIPQILAYDEHKQALLIACKVDLKTHQKEARAYLLSIKDRCEKDNFAGFAFMRV